MPRKYGNIIVTSISDPTGTMAPSAGPNGSLGRLALESQLTSITGDFVSSINSVSPSAGNITFTSEVSNLFFDIDLINNRIVLKEIISLSVSLNGGTLTEVGASISGVNLTWAYNQSDADPNTSQTLNQGIGSITPLSTRSYNYTPTITTDTTFTITSIDSLRGSSSSSTSVLFRLRRYWGVTANAILTESDILSGSSDLITSSNPDNDITYDCTGGRYYWYAYPDSWGTLSTSLTKVNGLSFSGWSDNSSGQSTTGFTINVTNVFGHTELYRVYKVYNLQNGSSIPVNFRD